MFDYQAGEKYKLTLILVGFAGAMIGMFFTLLLSPSAPPTQVGKNKPKWASNGDVNGGGQVTGGRRGRAIDGYKVSPEEALSQETAAQPFVHTDENQAVSLVQGWLALAWDFNATTASASQEKAMQYMSADCAGAYRQNIWTDEMAKTIAQSGAVSTFSPSVVKVGETRQDGAVVVVVEGRQVLEVPGKGSNSHEVKLEYLVKQTSDGKMQIAGIAEAGKSLGM
ncbi:MAG: hypothetical protein SGJ27_23660 [Candidatus Melainabacteria bacterium]|nr:hypothetical protein [Candidatus Melainabacteria bacterium]